MRSIYSLLLLGIFTIPSFSQSPVLPFIQHLASKSQKTANYRLEEGKVKLDSIVAQGMRKEAFEYDARGNHTVTNQFNWNPSSGWVPIDRLVMSYDSAGNDTTLSYSVWNSGKFIPSYRAKSKYDSQSNLLSTTTYNWDSQKVDWAPNSQLVFTLLPNGKEHTIHYYNWQNEQWVKTSKRDYFYDTSGNNLEVELEASWIGNEDWKPSHKTERTYDVAGNMLTRISSYYSEGTNINWFPHYKDEYTYDANNRELSARTSEWTNNAWLLTKKTEKQYDQWGNTMSIEDSIWNNTDSAMLPSTRSEYAYNIDISASNLLLPLQYQGFSNHQLISYHFTNFDNPSTNRNNLYYYSEEVATDLPPSTTSPALSVYPNPCKGTFTIENLKETSECSLHTLEGKLFKRFALVAGETHTENNVPKGVYFVHLAGQVKKLVVE